MECQQYKFSSHAIKRMFERGIQKDEAISVIQNGEIIAKYPEDKPYPSYLFFAFVNDQPVHVLSSLDVENEIVILLPFTNQILKSGRVISKQGE